MSFVPCLPGSVFSPDCFPLYRETCPICNSALIDFVEKDGSDNRIYNRKLVRLCGKYPARKNILSSHQSKAHFFEVTHKFMNSHRFTYRQEHRVKQAETHPSKYLLLVEYTHSAKVRPGEVVSDTDLTEVTAKGNWRTLNVPGIWNPGKLTVDNYTEVYNKAKRLLHFT